MKCPHCSREIYFEESDATAYSYEKPHGGHTGYDVAHGFCPSCSELIVLFRCGSFVDGSYGGHLETVHTIDVIYPKSIHTRPMAPEIPKNYRKDFSEAEAVLSASPKASAAISRRLLQDVLRKDFKLKGSSLAKEITDFLTLPGIPSYLTDAVDAVRNVGNIAAHPTSNVNTGQIVDVEPGEAEWLLEVLESLFDFKFVQPARLVARKNKLNSKLASAGKQPMK